MGDNFCITCGEYISLIQKYCKKFPCRSSNLSLFDWIGLKLKNIRKLCKKTNEPNEDDRFL